MFFWLRISSRTAGSDAHALFEYSNFPSFLAGICVWSTISRVRASGRNRKKMGSSLRQRSFAERFRKCLRISLTFLFSQVGLMAVVVAYSAAGAVLFEWLEADQEIEPRRKILHIRLDCLDRFRLLAGPLFSTCCLSDPSSSLAGRHHNFF